MKLYNTLSQKLETFKPREGNEVKMYVCGITPYDTTHLGHAFTYLAFDVLQRFLKYQGYKVTYVQNVTDIDDDILKRAKQVKQDWKELGNFWTHKFLTDLKALNIDMPTHYVKATETIPTIIVIVQELKRKGFAYEKNGNVYFDVQKDKNYGKLSKYTEKEMIKLSKERGANPDDPLKRHPLDFILWQKRSEVAKRTNEVLSEVEGSREPFWASPWGKGRPGWHIECSAMIYKYLDKYIDIHGGGKDLIYPHHESEIAQSEMFTGKKPFVKTWMHTGAVGYQGEKMSKSLGNLVMVSDLLKTYSPNTIRYLLLSHHYREPWEYKDTMIKTALNKISPFEKYLTKVIKNASLTTWIPGRARDDKEERTNDKLFRRFNSALQNDLNSPQALQVLEEAIMQKDFISAKKMMEILGFII